mmetsp:Transcript_38475/g.73867  ORF Transcript_38475/g.73867 Transcript_38475/m.73867 type:complete len:257 (+) Transcript_38475:1903-2673(+)
MVQGDVRCDTSIMERIDELIVPVNCFLVHTKSTIVVAVWDHTRPSNAEAIVLEAHGFHQCDVIFPCVPMVACHITSGSFCLHCWIDFAWRLCATVTAICSRHANGVGAGESVPDGSSTTILSVGTLDLVGRSAQSPDECWWKCAIKRWFNRVILIFIRFGIGWTVLDFFAKSWAWLGRSIRFISGPNVFRDKNTKEHCSNSTKKQPWNKLLQWHASVFLLFLLVVGQSQRSSLFGRPICHCLPDKDWWCNRSGFTQ